MNRFTCHACVRWFDENKLKDSYVNGMYVGILCADCRDEVEPLQERLVADVAEWQDRQRENKKKEKVET